MSGLLLLEDDRWRVHVAPHLGGGLASADAKLPSGPAPVLRPWSGEEGQPFTLGMNVLAPFSNRISAGGFEYGGTVHDIPRNLEGEPCPIHGDAFQRPWDVAASDDGHTRLRLAAGSIGPFRYLADLEYRLQDGRLEVRLAITNKGPRLPFGGGFHPWFPRRPGTRLSMVAQGVWLEDSRYLPTEHVALSETPSWDFSGPRALPPRWINNAFTGWDGRARIDQPELGVSVSVRAEPPLAIALLYSPGEEADVFCLEPVSHVVDAFNLAGRPGLVDLETGEAIYMAMSLEWNEADK